MNSSKLKANFTSRPGSFQLTLDGVPARRFQKRSFERIPVEFSLSLRFVVGLLKFSRAEAVPADAAADKDWRQMVGVRLTGEKGLFFLCPTSSFTFKRPRFVIKVVAVSQNVPEQQPRLCNNIYNQHNKKMIYSHVICYCNHFLKCFICCLVSHQCCDLTTIYSWCKISTMFSFKTMKIS